MLSIIIAFVTGMLVGQIWLWRIFNAFSKEYKFKICYREHFSSKPCSHYNDASMEKPDKEKIPDLELFSKINKILLEEDPLVLYPFVVDDVYEIKDEEMYEDEALKIVSMLKKDKSITESILFNEIFNRQCTHHSLTGTIRKIEELEY